MRYLLVLALLHSATSASFSWPWTDYGCKKGDLVTIELLSVETEGDIQSGISSYNQKANGFVFKVNDRGIELLPSVYYNNPNPSFLKAKKLIPWSAIKELRVIRKAKGLFSGLRLQTFSGSSAAS